MTQDRYNISPQQWQAWQEEWQQAMQGVTVYQNEKNTSVRSQNTSAKAKIKMKQQKDKNRFVAHVKQAGAAHYPPLAAGKFAGVDAATVKRIKRGAMPIQATLDLHGLTQEQAHMALQRFVMQHLMGGARLLLIITGKGSGGEGVLKQSLPKWLNDEALRPYLLAFDWARRDDGGSGAAYLLLKRLVVQENADNFGG